MPDDSSVPLAHYLQSHPGTGVRFTCDSCQGSRDVPLISVVERLKARGLGDEQTGIREVARFAEKPCAQCGAMKWETRPAWTLPGKA